MIWFSLELYRREAHKWLFRGGLWVALFVLSLRYPTLCTVWSRWACLHRWICRLYGFQLLAKALGRFFFFSLRERPAGRRWESSQAQNTNYFRWSQCLINFTKLRESLVFISVLEVYLPFAWKYKLKVKYVRFEFTASALAGYPQAPIKVPVNLSSQKRLRVKTPKVNYNYLHASLSTLHGYISLVHNK